MHVAKINKVILLSTVYTHSQVSVIPDLNLINFIRIAAVSKLPTKWNCENGFPLLQKR